MSVPAFHKIMNRVALMALSATCFISCGRNRPVQHPDPESLITMQSTNHTLINSVNGNLSYRAETPLLERYELAKQPYMEFRKGIHVITYNDSTHLMESEIVANYAKFIEPLELWEARGNVIAKNASGMILETEQLFWDQKLDRIYSNVDSKVTQEEDVVIGIGFESNSKFDNYVVRKPKGQMMLDTEPNRDSTTVHAPADSLHTPLGESSPSDVEGDSASVRRNSEVLPEQEEQEEREQEEQEVPDE